MFVQFSGNRISTFYSAVSLQNMCFAFVSLLFIIYLILKQEVGRALNKTEIWSGVLSHCAVL